MSGIGASILLACASLGACTPELARSKPAELELLPPPSQPGQIRVFFEAHSATITPEASELVDAIVEIAEGVEGTIPVVGHADAGERGNLFALSKARAEAVADALVTRGIARARVTINARGTEQPLATAPRANDPLNRRVEVNLGPAAFSPEPPKASFSSAVVFLQETLGLRRRVSD